MKDSAQRLNPSADKVTFPDATRQISWADQKNWIDQEIEQALASSPEENLRAYCQVVAASFALSGVDIFHYQPDKTISYVEG